MSQPANLPRPPLRLAIVDDEAPARHRLRELLADCSAEVPTEVVAEAANGLQALAVIDEARPEVALLDINMPGMGGIELARHLLRLESPPAVIFITAHDQHAVSAFEVNAIDYLLKPVRAVRLAAALKKLPRPEPAPAQDARYAQLDGGPRRFLSISERGKVQLVPVEDILFLKADAKYVLVRTAKAEHLLEESLNRLEEEFGARFVRIHRSCLVTRERIRAVQRSTGEEGEGWSVLLEGWAEPLPVSRRQWPQVKELVRA